MFLFPRTPLLLAGLALGLVALLAGCLRQAPQESVPTMTANSLPPIDRAIPAQIATATFALG